MTMTATPNDVGRIESRLHVRIVQLEWLLIPGSRWDPRSRAIDNPWTSVTPCINIGSEACMQRLIIRCNEEVRTHIHKRLRRRFLPFVIRNAADKKKYHLRKVEARII